MYFSTKIRVLLVLFASYGLTYVLRHLGALVWAGSILEDKIAVRIRGHARREVLGNATDQRPARGVQPDHVVCCMPTLPRQERDITCDVQYNRGEPSIQQGLNTNTFIIA